MSHLYDASSRHSRMYNLMIKHIITILIVLMTLGQAMGGLSAFAADEDVQGESSEPAKSSKLIASSVLPEDQAIEQYGFYNGKNAVRIPVITYHRVVSNSQKKKNGSSLYISKSNFDKQMKWLKKHKYRTINCQEFQLWYDGKIRLPKKTVLITFDDSRACIAKYAFPVMKKYGLKGTVFTIGHGVRNSDKGSIKKKQFPDLQEQYPTIEYQSHTYALHKMYSEKGDYKKVKKDAEKQYRLFGFEYLAYPYGRNTPGMRKAYKEAGIKIAFTYGQNGYATKRQNRYQIMRIKINGNDSFSHFRKWFH